MCDLPGLPYISRHFYIDIGWKIDGVGIANVQGAATHICVPVRQCSLPQRHGSVDMVRKQ